MYVNEMQRTVNGLGHGHVSAMPIPYGHWQPFKPGAVARGQFGDVPNDFEASVDLQYIPVRQGWYYGQPVDGRGYPDAGLPKQGLGMTTEQHAHWMARMHGMHSRGMGDAASDAAMQQLAKTERLRTVLQVVSTLSVATMATLAVVRMVRRHRGHGSNEPFLGEDE